MRQQLTKLKSTTLGSLRLLSGQLSDQQITLAHSGVGQVAMAICLTRLLTHYPGAPVLLCGCGGSYPDSGLLIGDLALASAEIHGDLGVATASGFIPLEQLDIPCDPQYSPPLQQTFDLASPLLEQAKQRLPQAKCGPFVTINCCSGHPQLSAELQRRTGGICENMEGAAAAQVCAEFSVPLLELRGISNPTGTRDPQLWDIKAGAEAAQRGLLQLLEAWPPAQERACVD